VKVLVFGIGNPGRQDDGLGPLLVERAEKELPEHLPPIPDLQIDYDANYQLNVEDAEAITAYDLVCFVDASKADIESCRIERVTVDSPIAFSTHSMSPGGVVGLAGELYDSHPLAYLLEVRGYSWEPNEPATEKARKNLESALVLLTETIRTAAGE